VIRSGRHPSIRVRVLSVSTEPGSFTTVVLVVLVVLVVACALATTTTTINKNNRNNNSSNSSSNSSSSNTVTARRSPIHADHHGNTRNERRNELSSLSRASAHTRARRILGLARERGSSVGVMWRGCWDSPSTRPPRNHLNLIDSRTTRWR